MHPNQRRHLAAALGLLLDDLGTAEASLPEAPWTAAGKRLIAVAREQAAAALARFGTGPTTRVHPAQRLAALCGVWLARLHDLRAAKLSAYGPVAPGLAGQLDPVIAELERSLVALLALAEGSSR